MKRKNKKLYPVPEAIDGKPWDIRDGRPQADCKSRVMFIPTQDTPAAAFLRAHETAHAKITPKVHPGAVAKKHKVSIEGVQCVEDLRVHTFLERRGIARPPSLDLASVERMVQACADNHRVLASMLIGAYGTGDYESLSELVNDVDGGEVVVDAAMAVCKYFEACVSSAKDKKHYGKKRTPLNDPRGFKDCTIPAARLFDTLFPPGGDTFADTAKVTEYMDRFGRRSEGVPWGSLPPPSRARMTKSHRPKKGGGRCWRDEGSVMTAPYRLILDGRIFSRKKRLKGGTVLVDKSGSMDLSEADLEAIVAAAPGAVVAAYAGRAEHGKVVIVAERGRMATGAAIEDALPYSGNIVDGPALKWLAKMPAPRIWVSDAMVTGCHDQAGPHLIRECVATMQAAGIVRVDKANAVADLLKAQK